MKASIRNIRESDIDGILELVRKCHPLRVYDKYVYALLARCFSETCFVAEMDEEIIGFISGFATPDDPSIFFLWQFGVIESCRGKLLTSLMAKHIASVAKKLGCQKMQFTMYEDSKRRPAMLELAKSMFGVVSEPEVFLKTIQDQTSSEKVDLLYEVNLNIFETEF